MTVYVTNATDALRALVRESGMPATRISANLGHGKTYIGTFITLRRDVRTSTLARIARECGYVLTLVPEGPGEPIEILPE